MAHPAVPTTSPLAAVPPAPQRRVLLPFAVLLTAVLGVAAAVGVVGRSGDSAVGGAPAPTSAAHARAAASSAPARAAASAPAAAASPSSRPSPSPTAVRVDLAGQVSAAVAQDRAASAAWGQWVTGVTSTSPSALTVATRLSSASSGVREAAALCSDAAASSARLDAAFELTVTGAAGTPLATCRVTG